VREKRPPRSPSRRISPATGRRGRRSNLTGLQGFEHLRGSAMEWPDIVEMAGVWANALGIRALDGD
jgi:hypothetical protein